MDMQDLDVELYYDKSNNTYIIKHGEDLLRIDEAQFLEMRQDGRSPLLRHLWNSAKRDRSQLG